MPGKAIIRRPSQLIATPEAGQPAVNADRAFAEWMELVQVLATAGWQIVVLEPADDVRSGFRVGRLAVAGNKVAALATAEVSVGELAGVEVALLTAGYQLAVPAGRFVPADAAVGPGVVYVAAGGSDDEGLTDLDQRLAADGVAVVRLPVTGPISVLPDGAVLGPDTDPVTVPYVGAPEPTGQSVLALTSDRVLVSASAPRTARMLEERGVATQVIGIGELERAGAVLGDLALLLPR